MEIVLTTLVKKAENIDLPFYIKKGNCYRAFYEDKIIKVYDSNNMISINIDKHNINVSEKEIKEELENHEYFEIIDRGDFIIIYQKISQAIKDL